MTSIDQDGNPLGGVAFIIPSTYPVVREDERTDGLRADLTVQGVMVPGTPGPLGHAYLWWVGHALPDIFGRATAVCLEKACIDRGMP